MTAGGKKDPPASRSATEAGERGEKASLKSAIDPDFIRELAKLLDETGLSEIELERNGERVRVARATQRPLPAAPAPAPMPAPAAQAASDADISGHPGLVTSPMVGTAYLAPEPGAHAAADLDIDARAGETLLIVEAMKTMNQIPAPRAGIVTRILIEDGTPVEFGEPLMIIE